MKVVQSWLRRYVPFRHRPEELAAKLGMLGLETAGIELPASRYEGFVVGRVAAREPHPHADRLSVCSVDVGHDRLTVVCGAPNVAVDQKVAVGLVGATVPKSRHGDKEGPLVLTRMNLRGVESSGMICSEYELDLGKDAEGILVLEKDAPVGRSLASYLGLDDAIYDIEITPNRPDWLSHIGVAREIGALVNKKVKIPAVKLKEGSEPINRRLAVRVEDRTNCLRFAARMIRNVKLAPSPRWMQNALRNAGLRPLNNVVDVTNYVMLECGHPLHAFDYALLEGEAIVVRQAAAGVSFTTLDGKAHTLPEGTVMVCDAEREVSIAGIMGGENSEINESTVDIVLESAAWNPTSIRRTSKALGIVSDASQRFERGADPNAVLFALDRAAQLILETAGGDLLKGVIDIYPRKVKKRIVPLRPARATEILGVPLTGRQIVSILGRLEIQSSGRRKDAILFTVPTYRVDIEREIDLIEEVARVFGYEKIPERTSAAVEFTQPFPRELPQASVRETLIGLGFQEAVTNSMLDEAQARLGGMEPVEIMNPQNLEMSSLRTSLVPGLLMCVGLNQRRGNRDLRLFEIGRVFGVDHSDRPKPVKGFLEEERVCLVLTGLANPRHWSQPPRQTDIYDAKGAVEDLLRRGGLDKGRFISYSTSNGLTDSTLRVEIHGGYAGYLGRMRSEVLRRYDIEQDVFVAELRFPSLRATPHRTYAPLAKFPRVRRDVAFTVDSEVSAERLEGAIRGTSIGLLQSVELFDVYEGDPLPPGRKSVAFSLELMSREKTLTDSEIDAAVSQIVKRVEQIPGVELRGLK